MSNIASILTESEKRFLREQGIRESDVFDGRSLSKTAREAEARRLGMTLIVGPECSNAGHRLRTRSGHCVQCDTSKIKYQSRHREEGTIYVAYSPSIKISKIGVSIEIDTREQKLNFDCYAGASDWEILFSVQVVEAGRVEALAQQTLGDFRKTTAYLKDRAFLQNSKEAFACVPIAAVDAVLSAIASVGAEHGKRRYNEQKLRGYSEA